jgi:hypothetical protein
MVLEAREYFANEVMEEELRTKAVVFCIRPAIMSDHLKMYRRCFMDAAIAVGFVRFEEDVVRDAVPIMGVKIPPE